MINILQPQPAQKMFPFEEGWRLIRSVAEDCRETAIDATKWWREKIQEWASEASLDDSYFIKACIYLGIVLLILSGIGLAILAALCAVFALTAYIIFLCAWALILVVMISLCAFVTFLYTHVYTARYRCPKCHRSMSSPIFLCAGCGAEHTQLWPNLYGIWKHRCNICDTQLNTIEFFGRNQLERLCANPDCRRQLNELIGTSTNIHIPIVGGPSAGKSNYIVMATDTFISTFEDQYNYSITFGDPIDKHNFEESRQHLATGRELTMTPDIVPQAYILEIKAPRALGPSKLLYIYDAAGEIHRDDKTMSLQEYYKYINGIIFVIDPCAIPAYYRAHKQEIEALRTSLRPSQLDVMSIYQHMMDMFEPSTGVHRGRYPHPIAIVVTKVDALGLEDEIGAPAAHDLMKQDPTITTEEDAINILVQKFLDAYGLDNLVRSFAAEFSNVKYFSCSALGRLPHTNNTQSYSPIRVLEPLAWILVHVNAIKAR